MKSLEKHLLILEPLLEELAPLGYFRKGKQLWHINRKEGYAFLIESELYARGTFKSILVQYGSFWKDVIVSSSGVSLASMLALDDRCIPFDTLFFDPAEELEKIVRDSAACMVDQFKQQVLPILRMVHDLPSFVRASEMLNTQSAGVISWPRGERVWDYLALGDQESAYAYLQHQIQYSWRAVFEQSIAALPPDEQEKRRREHEHYDVRLNHLEAQHRSALKHMLMDLQGTSDDRLAAMLLERFTRTETALAAWIGSRRWNQL